MAISKKNKDAWVGVADCLSCSLRQHVLFCNVDTDVFDSVACPIDEYVYKPGRVIYKKGDRGDGLFTLRSGLIKLERYLPDGNRRIVRLITPNDIFGMEILVSDEYDHDAVVLESAELCKISNNVIEEMSKNNSGLCRQIMVKWQEALSEADHWLTDLLSGTAKQRVARLLIMLSRDSESCALLSRDDMGSLLSITTETTSRIIAEFKRNAILKDIGGGRFSCDQEQLNEVAF